MSWEKVKLGDVCTKIGSGATPKGGSTVYIEKGTSFIRSQNVYNLSFDYGGLVFINDEAANKLKGVTVEEKDVLLNITGDSVARTCLVPSNILPARVNQHVAIVRPNSKVLNPVFLNYYLASPYMQAFMLGLAVGKGASRNAMTKDMISGFEVPCPAIEVQQKVVDILRPYDNLIENNQKQIKLLEEAAQRLYKEWFVDLHFPGYEDVEIVDGVPEGWYKGFLKELINVNYGKDHKKAPESGSIPVYGSGGFMRKCNKSLFSGEAVLIPRKGSLNHIMYVNEEFWTVDTMFFATMKQPHTALFVYFYMRTFDMYGLNIGAAVPSMTVKILNAMDILIPTKELIDKFDNIAQQYFRKIFVLDKQKEQLSQARDRLLPKLMSGELEV